MRRIVFGCLALLVAGQFARAEETPLSRIVFGSGLAADRPQPIWNAVLDARPELFVFVGDAVFLDTDVPDIMKTKYAQLSSSSGFQDLKNACTVMATWGGHDYGAAGAGANFREKAASSKQFREFWDLKNMPAEGNYSARIIGPPERRVQVILLDTRYFRVPPRKGGDGTVTPSTLLGDAQWKWLTEQLAQPADVRLIVTPTPITPGTGESWTDYPEDKQRLTKAISDAKANGVIILAGERVGGELNLTDIGAKYPVFEAISHGLNTGVKQWTPPQANPKRIASLTNGDTYGVVLIDWARPDPEIRIQGRDVTGDVVFQQKVDLSTLRIPGSVPERPKVSPSKPGAPIGAGAVTAADATKRVGDKLTVEFEVKNTGTQGIRHATSSTRVTPAMQPTSRS